MAAWYSYRIVYRSVGGPETRNDGFLVVAFRINGRPTPLSLVSFFFEKFLRVIDGNLWNSRLSHLMSATKT